jgi:hypothetical protein
VRAAGDHDRAFRAYRDDLGAPAEEIEQITGMTPDKIKPHVNTMERYGLVFMTRTGTTGGGSAPTIWMGGRSGAT